MKTATAKKILRTSQTFLPGGSDSKYVIQRSYRRALRRVFEPDFHALRAMDLPLDAVLVDIGANRGQSIDAMRRTAPARHIESFEPNPRLAQRLSREYGADGDVTVHDVALGARADQFTLHIPSYRGYVFDGLASLDRAEAEGWLVDSIYRFDPALLSVKEVDVRAVPLDSFGLSPSFMKLDVQGLELEVLRGASETLAQHHPALLVETPSPELVDFVARSGYRPKHWTGSAFGEGIPQNGNTFFL